ncbi:leukotriene-B4 omega-hydroxylase 3-like [Saccoglossus kowalevskii]
MLILLTSTLRDIVYILYSLIDYHVLLLIVFGNVMYTLYQQLQTRWRAERDLAGIPSPDRHWLFGNIILLKNTEAALAKFYSRSKELSPASVLWLGPFAPVVLLNHPQTVKVILCATDPKDDLFYHMLKPWLGDGLLMSKGQKWFRNRLLVTPGFHFGILRPYVQIYNECVKTMLDKWSDLWKSVGSRTCSIEVFEHAGLLTLDILLKCIFSQDSNCQTTSSQHPYVSSVHALTYLIAERIRCIPYHNDMIYNLSISGYKFRKALRSVHGYSARVIQERKQALRQDGGVTLKRKYIDFLDILLTAKDEDDNGLSDKEIQDEVDTFMFEGHDTTASGLSWCMYYLATHPEHQRKCQEEVDNLLNERAMDEIEWDDLSHLPYTTLCIKESMRIRSPVPVIGRELTTPLTLPNGRVIPAGYNVIIPICLLHHNELIWENPTRFDPTRFLPENVKDRSPFAFTPFSAGPRNCIGQHFAMNEMKIVIARTLRRFDLSPVPDNPPQRVHTLVTRSSNGIHLHVQPRNMG